SSRSSTDESSNVQQSSSSNTTATTATFGSTHQNTVECFMPLVRHEDGEDTQTSASTASMSSPLNISTTAVVQVIELEKSLPSPQINITVEEGGSLLPSYKNISLINPEFCDAPTSNIQRLLRTSTPIAQLYKDKCTRSGRRRTFGPIINKQKENNITYPTEENHRSILYNTPLEELRGWLVCRLEDG
ncbi:unnamed protein product, partial [Didymodactylos carnosus]